MSRKFWEDKIIDDFEKGSFTFNRFIEIHSKVSSKNPFYTETTKENEKSHFLLLVSALTNEELKEFCNKSAVLLSEINNTYSVLSSFNGVGTSVSIFGNNGKLATVKLEESFNDELYFCTYDNDDNLSNTSGTISSSLNLKDSLKEYINDTLLKSPKEDLTFNYNKYFLRLYFEYTELTKKGIDCDIYVSSEAGHYSITKKQLLKEFNKDNATSYLLSDANGQCIFNKEIFEEEEATIKDLEGVKKDGYALEFVKNQTEEMCLEAVKNNGFALKFVEKQTEEMCLEAVRQQPIALKFVEKQTKEMCLEAVKQNGIALKYVKNQTEDICLEAVKQNEIALKYVENKTPAISKVNEESLLNKIKEIAPNYKILTIDEYNSKLFMKIENKEELESKYTKFLELELIYLQKNFYVVPEQDEEQDIDNSVSLHK